VVPEALLGGKEFPTSEFGGSNIAGKKIELIS